MKYFRTEFKFYGMKIIIIKYGGDSAAFWIDGETRCYHHEHCLLKDLYKRINYLVRTAPKRLRLRGL